MNTNKSVNLIIVAAFIAALLGVLGPLLSIFLENNADTFLGGNKTVEVVSSSQEEDTQPDKDHSNQEEKKRSFTEFGAVGDWLGGSSVPFLTLATLMVALSTFNEQRKELKRIREESKNQTNALNIQRFEHTFFLLLEEVKKRHDHQEYYASFENGDLDANKYRTFLEDLTQIMPNKNYIIENNPHITNSFYFDYAIRYKNIQAALNNYYIDWRMEQIRKLKQITGKIFELFSIYNLPEPTSEFYAEVLKIQLSKPAISALLYLSLEDFYHSDLGDGHSTNSETTFQNSVIRNFAKFDFFEYMLTEHADHLAIFSNDYLFFDQLTKMNEHERMKFHNDSVHLI